MWSWQKNGVSTPETQELEAKLKSATEHRARLIKAGKWVESAAIDQSVLLCERKLAAAKKIEHAVPVEFPIKWNTGAPCPHLFRNDSRAFLAFYVHNYDPNWDGTYVRIVNPAEDVEAKLALVEFEDCVSAKLGSPNEEVFSGHPLYGQGLESYTAQEVINSRWLAELQKINSVHSHYSPERWCDLKHYVFWFHDSTFECVAASYNVDMFKGTWRELLASVSEKLIA